MIKNKQDYLEYLQADAAANHFDSSFSGRINLQRKFLRQLRKVEYLSNVRGNKFRLALAKYRFYQLSVKTGFTIPPNTFGKGLFLPHLGTIVVNTTARLGDDCIVQCGVNISEDVVGGNHLFLGAGCKLMIGVNIADDVIVGANAVVTKDVAEPNIVVAGVPAKKISDRGFKNRGAI